MNSAFVQYEHVTQQLHQYARKRINKTSGSGSCCTLTVCSKMPAAGDGV